MVPASTNEPITHRVILGSRRLLHSFLSSSSNQSESGSPSLALLSLLWLRSSQSPQPCHGHNCLGVLFPAPLRYQECHLNTDRNLPNLITIISYRLFWTISHRRSSLQLLGKLTTAIYNTLRPAYHFCFLGSSSNSVRSLFHKRAMSSQAPSWSMPTQYLKTVSASVTPLSHQSPRKSLHTQYSADDSADTSYSSKCFPVSS